MIKYNGVLIKTPKYFNNSKIKERKLKMRFNKKLKTALIGAVVASSVAVGVSTGVNAWGPAYEIEYTYYDDNGNYVGTKLYTCWGGRYTTGEVTSNYDVVKTPCENEF